MAFQRRPTAGAWVAALKWAVILQNAVLWLYYDDYFEILTAHPMMEQRVMLVNESDEVTGEMEKLEAHRKGVLHRAFSVFIFNLEGELLLQRRALDKYHSAGLWTNTCCSHPSPGEDDKQAARRRLTEEMGFTTELEKLFSFTYRAAFGNGLIEHELDHVFAGLYDGPVIPDPTEVMDTAYRPLSWISAMLETDPEAFTVWFRIAFPRVRDWAEKQW